MSSTITRRDFVRAAGSAAALLSAGAGATVASSRAAQHKDHASPFATLDQFIRQYMRDMNARYAGPAAFNYPAEWQSYLGHFYNENAMLGSVRIVMRKGTLMMDGVVPLEPAGNGRFLVRDEAFGPDWMQFLSPVNGKAMQLKLSGEDLWRVMTD